MFGILFYAALSLIVYTYVVFPVIVLFRGWVLLKPHRQADITPTVSLIIACYNEAEGIEAKLQNVLRLDYPRDSLQVLVASDGSTDGTDNIVARYTDRGINFLSLPRRGKAPALNAAVAKATGEILVFSDANSQYAHDAISRIVRPFADPRVGGVAGNQVYKKDHSAASGAGEKSYWNFDRLIKQAESDAGNAISATGAIYAIRQSLFQLVPDGVTDDFVTSTRVIAQGYRLVFAADAVAYEPVAESQSGEFRRKVRVMTRGLRAVWLMRELLNPLRHGFYAIQLFSHKVLRRLVAVSLLVFLAVSLVLYHEGLVYRVATIMQVAFYAVAAFGVLLSGTRPGRMKLFALPSFFCMVNLAALTATWNVLRGRRIDRWDTQRSAEFQKP